MSATIQIWACVGPAHAHIRTNTAAGAAKQFKRVFKRGPDFHQALIPTSTRSIRALALAYKDRPGASRRYLRLSRVCLCTHRLAMPQNAEASAFLDRVVQLPAGPGVSLDPVLQPSLNDEAVLRKLFAQDKANPRLRDPHVGLVDIFDAPPAIRATRARVVSDADDLSAKYILPLADADRRQEGAPCMVDSLEEFQKNWAIFTESSLSQLTNWNNVVVAGGAVQACLTPVPEKFKASKRTIRKHYHSNAFPTSDVDLFLYGLSPEQAEVKINEIYEAVRDSIPWDVTCIRNKHTSTFICGLSLAIELIVRSSQYRSTPSIPTVPCKLSFACTNLQEKSWPALT